MQKLAIYDMDKTITRKATFGPFIWYVVRKHRRRRGLLLPVMLITSAGYGLKLLSRSRLKEINLLLLMGRKMDRKRLDEVARGFGQETKSRNLLMGALARIEADRQEGYRIILATASYRFYVDHIAQQMGIEDVIATDCRQDSSLALFPRIDGENCYADAKLRMVSEWLDRKGIDRADAHIRFYSDHASDAPCLDWADEAFATNAHPPLARLARKKGWRILNWLSES